MTKNIKPPVLLRHDTCNICYFKQNNQATNASLNECTLCYLNMQAIKTNNFKPLPTTRKQA